MEDYKADGSRNSSNLTIDHEEEHGLKNRLLSNSTSLISRELLNFADEAILFQSIDFGPIRRDIANSITKKFSNIIGYRVRIEILDEALENITNRI